MGDERSAKARSGGAGGAADGGRAEWRRLHLWEIQFVRDLLLIAGVAGVLYLGYLARLVTVPLLLALALAYLFEPLIRRMRRTGLFSRRAAALTILAAVFVAVIVPVTLGAGFAVVQAAKAVTEMTDAVTRVEASVAKPEDPELRDRVPPGAWRRVRDFVVEADRQRGRARPTPPAGEEGGGEHGDMHALAQLALAWLEEHGQELGTALGQRVVGSGARAVGAAVSTAYGFGHLVLTVMLTGFFFYFLSVSWERVSGLWGRTIPEANRARGLELVRRMDRVISGFVRGRVTICFILGVYMTVAYYLAGVPAPLVLGPLVGLLFLVPFAHVLAIPVAMLLMAFDTGTGVGIAGTSAHWEFERAWWWIVLAPALIAWGAHLLDDWVLSPRIQGRTTDLAIPTILFASVAGGALAGIYGLLIAIPTAACLKILLQEVFWPRFRAWVEGRAADFLPIGSD